MKNNNYTGLEVAVVGMAFRTSDAANWRMFWDNLISSKEAFHFLSKEELLSLGMDSAFIEQKNYVNCTNNIIDKDCFDSRFFGYSSEEAKMMYPGHRFFHECVWEAIEDAGYNLEQIKNSMGIYAGAGEDIIWKTFTHVSPDANNVNRFYLDTINNKDYISSLVSYKLGLNGPSVAVNTACSTSLVAIHMACRALILGESKVALAGASSLVCGSQKGYMYEEGSIVSQDGHCKAFDKTSTGTVNGEGVGVVVLKRLKDAIHDNDNIYAVIKGSAVNNDGNHKVGFTAPSVEGQVMCIKTAQKFAQVPANTINYMEAHGTATKLGDSMEVEALNIAFKDLSPDYSCPIGSVKTNIGHLDTASGIAGFIKTALSVKNKIIPENLHFTEADPNINFENGPFYVNNKLSELKSSSADIPVRAGLNSFGVGGTNVHLILEEYPETDRTATKRASDLLVLSAKNESSLKSYFSKLRSFLETEPETDLHNMCHTYQVGRQEFDKRFAFAFNDREDLLQQLEKAESAGSVTSVQKNANIIFTFSGQGSQYLDMAKDLYNTHEFFRKIMDDGFQSLQAYTGTDFKKILYPGLEDISGEENKINQTCYTQPLIFLVEYAVAKLLMELGIKPAAMIGHSIGEYAAACISGLFSFDQALRLVVKRGELMQSLPSGSMISVGISYEEIQAFLNPKISVAAVNSPQQVVLSGSLEAIQDVSFLLKENHIPYVKIQTSHAFHSSMQDSILKEFEDEFQTVEFHSINIPFISNLTGEYAKFEDVSHTSYWAKHLRNTVKFSEGLSTVSSSLNNLVFVEVGAGNTLSSLIKQHRLKNELEIVNIIRPVKSQINDARYFLDSLGKLWSRGISVDWKKMYHKENRYKISLPTYAFDKTKYPVEIDHNTLFNNSGHRINSLKDSFYTLSWKRSLPVEQHGDEKNSEANILVFSGTSDFSDAFVSNLNGKSPIITVNIGKEFIQNSPDSFSMDPTQKEHYKKLFQALDENNVNITKVIYLWGIDCDYSQLDLREDNKELGLLYLSYFEIIKNWKESSNRSLFIFTNTMHQVLGNEKLNYQQSLVLGLLKTLNLENNINCYNIDIEDTTDGALQHLVSEIEGGGTDENRVIAYRMGQRWIQDFQLIKTDLSHHTSFTQNGVYLITGGLGNIGFILSKYLIENYQAKIIVLGRTDIENQSGILSKRYQILKNLSAETLYIRTDITDREKLKDALDFSDLSQKVNGIIHLAKGDDQYYDLAENLSPEQVIQALNPKIKGMENLLSIYNIDHLDFFWTASSVTSLYGTMGLSSYISSNTYAEYYTLNASQKIKCIGISALKNDESEKDPTALSPEEIIKVLETTIALKNTNLVYISKEDVSTAIKNTLALKINETVEKTSAEQSERPNLETSFEAPQSETEKKLQKVFETFLEIKNIGVNDDFFDLGGDSLRAIILLKNINKELNFTISIADFFSNRNIKALATIIDEKVWLLNDTAEYDHEIII